jgi:hypothetical protein
MKHIFSVLLAAIYTLATSAQSTVPADMLTPEGKYWTIGTVSSVNFYNTTPGAYYGTVKNGGGVVVFFKFKPGGKFENLVYVVANTYGTDTETWTSIEGTVEFTTLQGHTVFITHAVKGTYRIRKNGVETSRPVPASDLANQHSNTFLWEKWQNPDDNKRRYFLCINLDHYPQVKLDNLGGTVKPEWLNKFHVEE